jgi:hypothetical protein
LAGKSICTPARRANSFANICEAEAQALTRFLGVLESELLPRLLLVGFGLAVERGGGDRGRFANAGYDQT